MRKWARLLFFVLLLAVSFNAALPETPKAEAQKHYEQGMSLLNAKEKDKALEEFKRAVKLDENYVEAHRQFQDLVLDADKSSRQALMAEYRRKVETDPQNPTFHYLLGRLLEGKRQEKEFLKAIELDPNFFWGHLGLGYYYHESANDFARAEAEFRAALKLNPKAIPAYTNLAHVLSRHFGRIDEALAELEKAKTLATDPEQAKEIDDSSKEISGTRTFNLTAFFTYLVAALICTALFIWSIKGASVRNSCTGSDLAYPSYVSFSCLWYYILFILAAKGNIPFVGMREFGIIELLMFLCMAFWPAVVYRMVFLQRSEKIQLHKFYKAMTIYFYLSGAVLAGVFSYAFIEFRSNRINYGGSLLDKGANFFLANFIICTVLGVITMVKVNKTMRSASESTEIKSARRWGIFLWVLWLSILWVILLGVLGTISLKEYMKYFTLLSTLIPLPFLMVEAYYQVRYIFMDIFIKKSTIVFATMLIAVSYYLLVVDKLAQSQIWKGFRSPVLIILLPLIAAIPFLPRAIEGFVDRYIFKRQFSPSEALSRLSRSIRLVDSEDQLLDVAKNHISEIFATKNVTVFFSEDITCWHIPQLTEEFKKVKGPVSIAGVQISEVKTYCIQNEIEVIVPLIVDGEIKGRITLGKRYYREPYLSEDLNLLNSIADQIEFALENIRLERKRREQELKEKELKILASKAELRALRAQINPHFLFNTLNTIASLVRRAPNKAEETVEMLSDVFRYTLAKSGTDFVPLLEEINFIKAYLEVEKARFGDKLQVDISVDPEVEKVKVPSMILQPLVENAIKHGIAPKLEGGKIWISASRENGFLNLEVKDNGVGFDRSKSERLYNDGIGLKNVRDRIQAIYGTEEYLQIQSQPNEGTIFFIRIPTG